MKQWEQGMGEISGFGGGYEAVCRAMVLAAIAWIDENPEAELKAHSYENIYGIAEADIRIASAISVGEQKKRL